MKQLTTTKEVDDVFILSREQPVLLFKHSTQCPVSAAADTVVTQFIENHPKIPVFRVYVIEDRPVSQYIAQQTKVQHESPQTLVLVNGACVWDASHGAITLAMLENNLKSNL